MVFRDPIRQPLYSRGSVLDELFFRHPREQNETYIEHFKVAFNMGFLSCVGAVYFFVHAFVPGINLFETMGTSSSTHYRLIMDMISRKPMNRSR